MNILPIRSYDTAMKKTLITLAVTLGLLMVACTDEAGARHALDSAGYTEIELTGFNAFECGDDDGTATGFTAKNPAGKRVSGTVCCGIFAKGCTIRF